MQFLAESHMIRLRVSAVRRRWYHIDMSERPDPVEELERRIDLLERENQRLREKLEPVFGPDNPCFNTQLFTRILSTRMMLAMLPVYLFLATLPLASAFPGYLPKWRIRNIPVLDFAGHNSGMRGFGLGIVAVGGGSFGVISVGGFGVGLIAFGGAALGVIACGGGAVGLIAIGGGSFGFIAIGGGAAGYYALGQRRAYGRYVLAMNRQDAQAIELFTRLVPGLKRAFTTPMPVLPLNRP